MHDRAWQQARGLFAFTEMHVCPIAHSLLLAIIVQLIRVVRPISDEPEGSTVLKTMAG